VRFLLQVVGATALLTVFLAWSAGAVSWVDLRAQPLQRVGLLATVLAAAAVIYFGALWAAGVKLRQFVAR
jgi:putative peptidoglycan lipid II flippase